MLWIKFSFWPFKVAKLTTMCMCKFYQKKLHAILLVKDWFYERDEESRPPLSFTVRGDQCYNIFHMTNKIIEENLAVFSCIVARCQKPSNSPLQELE